MNIYKLTKPTGDAAIAIGTYSSGFSLVEPGKANGTLQITRVYQWPGGFTARGYRMNETKTFTPFFASTLRDHSTAGWLMRLCHENRLTLERYPNNPVIVHRQENTCRWFAETKAQSGVKVLAGEPDDAAIDDTIRNLNSELRKALRETFLDPNPNKDIYGIQLTFNGNGYQRETAVAQGIYTGGVRGKIITKIGPLLYIPNNYNGNNGLQYDETYKRADDFHPLMLRGGSLDTLFYVKQPNLDKGIASADGGSTLYLVVEYQFHSHPIHPLGESALSKADITMLDASSAGIVFGGAFNGRTKVFTGYYNKKLFSRTFDKMSALLNSNNP